SAGLAVAVLALLAGGAVALAGVLGGIRSRREATGEVKRAEEVKEQALSDKKKAEKRHEKGKRVARVLLGAHSKLGRVHAEIKTAYYDSSFAPGHRRKVYERWRKDIERFFDKVPDDTASQATATALKGWLLFHGGYEKEGLDHFHEAQDLDEDVAWVFFIEAMFWFGDYLMALELPLTWESDSGLSFRPHEYEHERMVVPRANFEALMKMADKATIWGEELSEEFPEVLGVFRGIQDNDPGSAVKGLTKALGRLWNAGPDPLGPGGGEGGPGRGAHGSPHPVREGLRKSPRTGAFEPALSLRRGVRPSRHGQVGRRRGGGSPPPSGQGLRPARGIRREAPPQAGEPHQSRHREDHPGPVETEEGP
ncbi:MAG: hypothetical protein ACYTFG_17215, partial [Planctomycetota bacterium]